MPSDPLEEAIADAQAIVVATNHSAYDDLLERLPQDVLLVDPWNATGAGEVFSRVRVPARGVTRVLVTGGAGTIGSAVVRRLIADPEWEVRVSDQREPPQWMREACEVHTGDLRDVVEARQAVGDCTHVIHLAAIVGGIGNFHKYPHTLLEMNTGALQRRVPRGARPRASSG